MLLIYKAEELADIFAPSTKAINVADFRKNIFKKKVVLKYPRMRVKEGYRFVSFTSAI